MLEMVCKGRRFTRSTCAGNLCSERQYSCPSPALRAAPKGEYLLLFDPLDGSSAIDVNVSVGTIFSVLQCPEGMDPTEQAFLPPGSRLVCAGYAVYGPTALLVLTLGDGVNVFTLDFNMRWVASMVADVHRILSRGGIFLYPIDSKTRDQGGKLRLMYEANPMAFIVEQAGGAATDGRRRILDIPPQKLHQRVPLILDSKQEVERITSYHAA